MTPAVMAQGLSIEKIEIGMETLRVGDEQLVEISIKNLSGEDQQVITKLVITLPNKNIITFGAKEVLAKSETISRSLMPYPIDKKNEGDYTVEARIYDQKDAEITRSEPGQEKYFYALDPTKRKEPPKRRRGQQLMTKKQQEEAEEKQRKEKPVQFEPPDLQWGKMEMVNTSVLRGETASVRMFLENRGGDLANKVHYSLYWFFSQRPNRKVRFFTGDMAVIAPGEQKILEVPFSIPESEQPGKYQVLAVLDENNYVKESDEKNNQAMAKEDLIFGDVALVFPEEGYSFAEDGLFQFQWRSKRYSQFKLQVSATPDFSNPNEIFELPKGEHWTPNSKITPLSGEMPTMALALMESAEVEFLFWRVVARDEQGNKSESTARKFYINLKPKQ